MRKVERLVNLIALLLVTRRPLTLEEVAELVPGYEASGESLRRMFERDKDELRGLGVPVERGPVDAWGAAEGYFIDPRAYGMPDLELTAEERTALALAARAWSEGGDQAATAAMAKLDVDPAGAPAGLAADLGGGDPVVAALLEAAEARKRVVFTYRPPGREAGERRLDPYALIHRRGAWYVVGQDLDRGAQRSFRLSRIVSAVRQARPAAKGPDFEVPAGFEASTWQPAAEEPEEAASRPAALVRADGVTARLARARGAEVVGEPGEDGSVVLRLPAGDTGALIAWALGSGATILAPEALRDAAAARLSALTGLLAGAADP